MWSVRVCVWGGGMVVSDFFDKESSFFFVFFFGGEGIFYYKLTRNPNLTKCGGGGEMAGVKGRSRVSVRA